MASRYGGITGTEQIANDYQNINIAFENVEADVDAKAAIVTDHINSTAAHAAEHITYSGSAAGDNVKDAIDTIDERIDTIIQGGGPDKDAELVDIRTPDPSYTPSRTINVAGDMVRDMQAQFSAQLAETAINLNQRRINVKYPPTPLVPAVGDGVTDDQPAIQAIIDYANTNGYDVFIPSGVYRLNDTIKRRGKVSIFGQGIKHTYLKFYKATGGAIIDTVNEPLHGVIVQGLNFTKDSSVTGYVTGILGGSTIELYNSAVGVFRDLKFTGLRTGISGSGVPEGVGIFDCTFERCWFNSCFNGLNHYGSGNVTFACRFDYNSGAGLVLGRLNSESMAGNIDINSEFVANAADITVPNAAGIRPCSFYNSWFERSINGIIVIPNMETKIKTMTFENCMLSTYYTGNLMSFYGAEGSISVNNCTLYQTESTHGKTIVAPATNGTLKVENCIGYNYDGTVFKPQKGNIFNGVPPAYWGENGDYAIDATNNRVYFKIGDAWSKFITLS